MVVYREQIVVQFGPCWLTVVSRLPPYTVTAMLYRELNMGECAVHTVLSQKKKTPMGGAPYHFVIKGVGAPLSVFNHKRGPGSCLQQLNALAANMIGQTITYNEATSYFEVKA